MFHLCLLLTKKNKAEVTYVSGARGDRNVLWLFFFIFVVVVLSFQEINMYDQDEGELHSCKTSLRHMVDNFICIYLVILLTGRDRGANPRYS